MEGEPDAEPLALREKELLAVAHGVGVREPHWLPVRLALPLPLAALEGEAVGEAREDWLSDTEPHCVTVALCEGVGAAEEEALPEAEGDSLGVAAARRLALASQGE